MLFNSYLFIFVFLPITLLGYYLTANRGHSRIAIVWLVAASLLFFGWYNPGYVALISCSILFNYFVVITITNRWAANYRKLVMTLGVTINILMLGYFKYAHFFIDNANAFFHSDFHLNTIFLPLAVSFFTLQQIAYLVDIYRCETGKHTFLNYCLFITFFPKLIAGPIVRSKELMPQIEEGRMPLLTVNNIAVGLTVFFLGLFEKVMLADNIGTYVEPVFAAAAVGVSLSFFNSWVGALSYAFQLYFDFTGYCDMAIGLGLMFGIRLPLNFYSPYRAVSIIDFWRRWHITLSRFLRDYLYIPLGGNRKGLLRQMFNLMIVMAIAGFWHGAGWTFVIWGTLHGLYLVINHCWRRLRIKLGKGLENTARWETMLSTLATFIAVVVAWVFFRADSIEAAAGILKGMAGLNGYILPAVYCGALGMVGQWLGQIGIIFAHLPAFSGRAVIWILVSLTICWFLPNVQEYMSSYHPSLDGFPGESKKPRFSFLRWKPSLGNAIAIALIAVVTILSINKVSSFIYSQF